MTTTICRPSRKAPLDHQLAMCWSAGMTLNGIARKYAMPAAQVEARLLAAGAILPGNAAPRPHPAARGPWCCAQCGRDAHAASVVDPSVCLRCARALGLRIEWKPAPFGKIRKVAPAAAARWEE